MRTKRKSGPPLFHLYRNVKSLKGAEDGLAKVLWLALCVRILWPILAEYDSFLLEAKPDA